MKTLCPQGEKKISVPRGEDDFRDRERTFAFEELIFKTVPHKLTWPINTAVGKLVENGRDFTIADFPRQLLFVEIESHEKAAFLVDKSP